MIAQTGGTGQVTVGCPFDHPYVLGGGAQVQAQGAFESLNMSAPLSGFPGGWRAQAADNSPVTVYAICAK